MALPELDSKQPKPGEGKICVDCIYSPRFKETRPICVVEKVFQRGKSAIDQLFPIGSLGCSYKQERELVENLVDNNLRPILIRWVINDGRKVEGCPDYYSSLALASDEEERHQMERGNGLCYLTTACCQIMGMKDDCPPLTNLRNLRDSYIAKLPDGPAEIAYYYLTAPRILERMTPAELRSLFSETIKPASDLVDEGKYKEAYEMYQGMVYSLAKRYLLPSTPGG